MINLTVYTAVTCTYGSRKPTGMVTYIEDDLKLTQEVCTNLLGPNAVADEKTEVALRIDVIGYIVDLDTQRVLIARKNFLSALHGFISLNMEGKISLRTAQRLASWASRYGKICRVMRPFCGALNRLIAGRVEAHASFILSVEAKIAVKCWQAMLCLVRHEETRFTRTLESFAPESPTVIAEFDSSLTGSGIVWYQRRHGAEEVVGVCAVDLTFMNFGDDSSFQNLAEFIGAILAVIGYILQGHRGKTLALRGHSVTALTWAWTERSRGSIVTNAAMIWTLLCVAADVNIRETTHIAGKDNEICDQLSRRGLNPKLTIKQHAEKLGVGGGRVIDAQEDATIMALLKLCSPDIVIESDIQFTKFWREGRDAVDALIARTTCPTHFLPQTDGIPSCRTEQ